MRSCISLKKAFRGIPGGMTSENFHHDGAGAAEKSAPGPEQAGIERNREAWRPEMLVEMSDAEFVGRWSARRTARAFGKDQDLAALFDLTPGAAHHVQQRLRAALAVHRAPSRPSRCTSRKTESTSIPASG